MQVTFAAENKTVTIQRGPEGRILPSGSTILTDAVARNESHLLYLLRNRLRELGYDVIKKLMVKDGHMVADTQHYLRSRSQQQGMAIWDSAYAVRDSAKDYNAGHAVVFMVDTY